MHRLAIVFSILSYSISQTAGLAAENKTDPNRIVVLISVDGLAGFYLNDPKAQMPTIRALADAGARAAMKVSTPSVTWPSHATLITGVPPALHGVVGNNFLDRATGKTVALIGDTLFDKDQIMRVPAVFDVAKAAGLKTASVRWPATRNAKSLDWTIPAVRGPDLLRKYSTPGLLEECRTAGIAVESRTGIADQFIEDRDRIGAVIGKRSIGRGEDPGCDRGKGRILDIAALGARIPGSQRGKLVLVHA